MKNKPKPLIELNHENVCKTLGHYEKIWVATVVARTLSHVKPELWNGSNDQQTLKYTRVRLASLLFSLYYPLNYELLDSHIVQVTSVYYF